MLSQLEELYDHRNLSQRPRDAHFVSILYQSSRLRTWLFYVISDCFISSDFALMPYAILVQYEQTTARF